MGIAKKINNGLTFNSKRLLENKIKDKKTKKILSIINAYCHPVPKINFDSAIKNTGIVMVYLGLWLGIEVSEE
tara:strand:+ start:1366 stop:1584 length:219 start_codon:yes stop_codon:yes gene_type:complete